MKKRIWVAVFLTLIVLLPWTLFGRAATISDTGWGFAYDGSASRSDDGKIELSATGYTQYGFLKRTRTTSITLTNNTGVKQLLDGSMEFEGDFGSFKVTLDDTTVTEGNAATSYTEKITMAVGSKLVISITSPSGSGTIKCTYQPTVTVSSGKTLTCYTASNGSYSINGTNIVADGTTVQFSVGDTLAIKTTPASGYVCLGILVNDKTLQPIDSTGSIDWVPNDGGSIKPIFAKVATSVAPFLVNNKSYYTWETACAAAGTAGTIVLTSTFTLPSTYAEQGMSTAGSYVTGADGALVYSLPAGVTLLLPYSATDYKIQPGTAEKNDFKHANAAYVSGNSSTTANIAPSKNVHLELCVPAGTTLKVANGTSTKYGRVVIGGTLVTGEGGEYFAGATYGAHANLKLDGTLKLGSYAVLSVTGYVYGEGIVETTGSGAEIYQPMVIRDWRGAGAAPLFVNSQPSYKVDTIQSGEGQIMPFTQWSTFNIQTKLRLNKSNYMLLYAGLRETDLYCSHPVLVGDSAKAGLIILADNAYLVSEYNEIAWTSTVTYAFPGKTTVAIYGGASLGQLTLDVKVSADSLTINTSDFTMNVSYGYDIALHNGSYAIEKSVGLLPGVKLTVAEDATLSIGSESAVRFMVYDGLLHRGYQAASSWLSGSITHTVAYAAARKDAKSYPTTAELQASSIGGVAMSGDAELVVEGTLVIGANASFGGVVQTTGFGTVDATAGTAGTVPNVTTQIGVVGSKYIISHHRYYAGMVLHERKAQLVSAATGERIDIVRGNTYYGAPFQSVQASYSFRYYAEANTVGNVILVGDAKAGSGETVKETYDGYTLNETIYGGWCIAMSEKVTLDSMFYLEDYVWFDGVMDVPVYKGEGTLTLISLDDRLQLPLIDGKPVADENGGLYVVRQMEAKSLSQKIKFRVKYTNGSTVLLSNVLVVDFQEYADAYIEANKNSQDEKIQKKVALVTVMKTYGDAAEIYFDEELKAEYNADKSITFPDAITLTGAKDTVMGFTGGAATGVTGASLKTNSAKVYFDEALRMSVFFTPTLPTGFDTKNIVKIGLLATSGTGTLTMANHETMYVLYSPTPPGTLGGSGNYPEEGFRETVNGTITDYSKLPDRDEKGRWELCFDLTNDMYGQVYELRPFMIVEDETGTNYVYGEQVHYSLAAYISRTYEKADNAFKNLLTATWDYVVAAEATF